MISCAVVIAVGSITHQSQLIYNRPRAMLPALGKPLVVRMMDRLHRAGIDKFVVVVGEDEGAVAAYLNQHWVPNAATEFVIQSKKQTLVQTLDEVVQRCAAPFIATSYNSFTHLHFIERLLKAHERDADNSLLLSGGLASLSNSLQPYYACVANGVVKIVREPQAKALVLSDLAICGSHFVDYLTSLPAQDDSAAHSSLISLFRAYVEQGSPASLVETAWTLQVETDYDLLTLCKHLLDEEQDANILSEIPPSVQIIPPVRIDPQVSIGQNASIGPYVYLESGCSIGARANIKNALILSKAVVHAGDSVSDAIVATRAFIRN